MLRSRPFRALAMGLAATTVLARAATPAVAQIYGTMSNFDTYNTTTEPAEGAQIELEGVHASSIYGTFPAHYNNETVTEYDNGVTFGTIIQYEDYNFNTPVTMGSLQPSPNPVNTNGHALVNTDGGEHFGFAVTQQPTTARFYWLNKLPSGDYERIGADPLGIPNPTWTYVPAAGGGAPRVEAEAELPEAHAKKADPVWMKVFKSEEDHSIHLDELISGNDPANIVPQAASQIETEWELLEGDQLAKHGGKLQDRNSKSVIQRYELFKYTGPVNAENEPTSAFANGDLAAPPEGELGAFIAANMVAADLAPLDLNLGDYNEDGVIDGSDFLKWQTQLGNHGVMAADGNDDSRVDDDDLLLWRTHYNVPPGAGIAALGAAASAVPEPTSIILLFTAVMAANRGTRTARNLS